MLRYLRSIKQNKIQQVSQIFRVFCSDNKHADFDDDLKKNPYYKKYADKLKNISPDEFKSKLSAVKKLSKKEIEEKKFSLGSPKPDITCSSTKRKTLDSVLKMELIKDKSSQEISDIWRKYHQKQDKISAIIPAPTYSIISQRAKDFPVFLYPIPRGQGFEFIMAQFETDECHFTALINYQAYKENAPECLTIYHYQDLMSEKGIVLMRGEFDDKSLSVVEAQFLANQMQMYYTSAEDDSKFYLLKKFTQQPDSFKHMDLITELQRSTFQLG